MSIIAGGGEEDGGEGNGSEGKGSKRGEGGGVEGSSSDGGDGGGAGCGYAVPQRTKLLVKLPLDCHTTMSPAAIVMLNGLSVSR